MERRVEEKIKVKKRKKEIEIKKIENMGMKEKEKKNCTVKNVSMETAKSINLSSAKSEGTKETFLMDGVNGKGGFEH